MSRKLTINEILMVKSMFLNSVNYSAVNVHLGSYIFFQPNDVIMTPNGEIYAPRPVFKVDYALENSARKTLFIHEMTHVWQYQNNILDPKNSGVAEFFRNAFVYKQAYHYILKEKTTLTDYYMEQQAAIVEEYFRVVNLGESFSRYCKNQESFSKKMELLKKCCRRNFFDWCKKPRIYLLC